MDEQHAPRNVAGIPIVEEVPAALAPIALKEKSHLILEIKNAAALRLYLNNLMASLRREESYRKT
jgi:hypothetical protein